MAQHRDPSEPNDSDDEVEIVVDTSQHAQKAKPHRQYKHKSRRSRLQHPTSTPPPAISASISVHTSSSPSSCTDVNSLAGLPLTILLAPAHGNAARTESATNVAQSFGRQHDAKMQRHAIRQGLCCEEPTAGAHGLLANPSGVAEPTTPLAHSVVCTTSSDSCPSQQHSDLGLDLDVFMGLTDSGADAEGVTDDEVVVPSPTPSTSPPLATILRHA